MQKLTNKEEEIMHILWKLEKAFVKDVLSEIQNDKPHYNTLSTIIRNLEEKEYVGYTAYGKTHQYFPIVSKEDYKKRFMNTAIENYFNKIATKDGLSSLNTAFSAEGAYIHIPKNKLVEKPIQILHFSTGNESALMLQPRNLVVVDENSHVQIIENMKISAAFSHLPPFIHAIFN